MRQAVQRDPRLSLQRPRGRSCTAPQLFCSFRPLCRAVIWQMLLVSVFITYCCTGMAYVLSQVRPLLWRPCRAAGFLWHHRCCVRVLRKGTATAGRSAHQTLHLAPTPPAPQAGAGPIGGAAVGGHPGPDQHADCPAGPRPRPGQAGTDIQLCALGAGGLRHCREQPTHGEGWVQPEGRVGAAASSYP